MPSPPSAPSAAQLQTSCEHALGLASQFLTLAAGGIAFVVGLVYSTERYLHPWIIVVVCALFGVSVVLGLMVRMGAVSDIYKRGICDIYSRPLRGIAALQVLLFLLGTAVLAAATFHRAFAQPEGGRENSVNPPTWMVTGKGMTEGISGLALVEHDSARTVLLAAYDNKALEQPRLSLLTRRAGERGVERRAVAWTGALPIDLEAICSAPGRPSEFLALTSKGDLYRLVLNRERSSVVVEAQVRMPNAGEAVEFESLDVRDLDGKLVACWAHRGSAEQPAVVSCATFDVEQLAFGVTSDGAFTSPWPAANARHLSDLRLTETGAVLAIATADPGDHGPFSSALYLAGRVNAGGESVTFLPDSAVRLWISSDHKVEAIEQVPGSSGGLVFAADDEARGGAVHFTW